MPLWFFGGLAASVLRFAERMFFALTVLGLAGRGNLHCSSRVELRVSENLPAFIVGSVHTGRGSLTRECLQDLQLPYLSDGQVHALCSEKRSQITAFKTYDVTADSDLYVVRER